ncbi:MAG TPA: hypothetical protein VKV04_24095 [Verrucomicrobiae bacterium]|nr:hypothetical protein [Verrucomicrobiae bacterium]
MPFFSFLLVETGTMQKKFTLLLLKRRPILWMTSLLCPNPEKLSCKMWALVCQLASRLLEARCMKPEWLSWMSCAAIYARWAMNWFLKTSLPQVWRWLGFGK